MSEIFLYRLKEKEGFFFSFLDISSEETYAKKPPGISLYQILLTI